MKSTLLKSVFACAGIAMSSFAVHAESVAMKVPFAFSAAGKTMPAGSYTVEAEGNILSLRGVPASAMVMTIPSDVPMAKVKAGAEFDESSELAVLSSVTLANGKTYSLMTAKRPALAVVSPPAGTVLSKRP